MYLVWGLTLSLEQVEFVAEYRRQCVTCLPSSLPSPVTQAQREALSVILSAAPELNERDAIRYLRARDWDAGAAQKMFEEYKLWRVNFEVDRLKESHVINELKTGLEKVLTTITNDCYPCYIAKPRYHFPKESDKAECAKFCVYVLERACQLAVPPRDKFCVIFDLEGASIRENADYQFAQEILGILYSNYPDRLLRAYVINAPWYFNGMWKLVHRFLSKATTSKFRVLTNKSDLLKDFDSKFLPIEYGGTGEGIMRFHQDVENAIRALSFEDFDDADVTPLLVSPTNRGKSSRNEISLPVGGALYFQNNKHDDVELSFDGSKVLISKGASHRHRVHSVGGMDVCLYSVGKNGKPLASLHVEIYEKQIKEP